MSFQPLDQASEFRRANVAKDLASFYAEMSGTAKPQQRFSLARLVNAMNDGKLSGCYEADVCKAAAISQGRMWEDSRTQIVPWGALMSRDLTVGSSTYGGNLVGSKTASPMDILRPFSVVARMGVSVVDRLTQNLLLPNASSATAATWLPDETSAIGTSDPVVGQVSSAPKTAGAIVKATHQFMKQAATADEFIRQQLLSAAAGALDIAVLQGTGASGQPTGLSIAGGLNAQSGAVTHANMLDAIYTLANANADDENIKFLTTPAVRRILQARETITGSGKMIWAQNQVADRAAHVTTDCPASTIFAGDWSKVLVAFWGSGLEIVVDPYTNFKTGAVQIRVMMSADVIVTKPAALLRHTSAS